MLHLVLEQRLRLAVSQILPDARPESLIVRPCLDPKFGDYQTPSLMALAKERKLNPRQLASDVLARLDVSEWCEKVELAGAGFLNFRLLPTALAAALETAAQGGALFFAPTSAPRTIVIDFSSPNVAKPMHVGHIRSTVLGDCLARILRLLGHHVFTDNHIGDWGTQFGMLLIGWKTQLNQAALEADPIAELERLYKAVNAASEANPNVREHARLELVKLQGGDPENLEIWTRMIELSQKHFDSIYQRLGVRFDHALGESFYNARLAGVVAELREQGLATESEGAWCIFSDGSVPPKQDPFLIQKDGEWKPNPWLVQKKDGGFNYATTDLATVAYRVETWQPDEIIYVTDGRQQLHFQQLFAAYRRWRPGSSLVLAHVWFGSILGEDGKPYKTRSGETVKLADLLEEAVERAFQVVTQKNPDRPEDVRREVARVVGIAAVKYADLLPNRQSDYVFSWDKMLSFQGNTAVYLLYAATRIRSIFRKLDPPHLATEAPAGTFVLSRPEEIALGRHLLQFGLVLEAVVVEYRPNLLCNYLYEVASLFARFYENCPVLDAEPSERPVRLALCDLTGRVLEKGLDVLGIEIPEMM